LQIYARKVAHVGLKGLNRGAGAESESEKGDSAHLWSAVALALAECSHMGKANLPKNAPSAK